MLYISTALTAVKLIDAELVGYKLCRLISSPRCMAFQKKN